MAATYSLASDTNSGGTPRAIIPGLVTTPDERLEPTSRGDRLLCANGSPRAIAVGKRNVTYDSRYVV
jgi:hypothetical protein